MCVIKYHISVISFVIIIKHLLSQRFFFQKEDAKDCAKNLKTTEGIKLVCIIMH